MKTRNDQNDKQKLLHHFDKGVNKVAIINSNCYLCNSKCKKYKSKSAADIYDCPNCGYYQISFPLLSVFGNEYADKKHMIAGFLGEINRTKQEIPYTLDTDSIKTILYNARIPKTTMQKLEGFLYYCYLEYEFIGQEFTQDPVYSDNGVSPNRKYLIKDANRTNIAYLKIVELEGVINAMKELGWVNITKAVGDNDNPMCYTLTAKGLNIAEQLMKGNKNSKKVFVAIEYHDDFQQKMENAIKPACKSCGFDAFLASDTEHNHNINDEMIVDIKRSKFVISDFTKNNEGAYYEAGYAEGMGLPVIKCCSQDWLKTNKLHFDVNHDKFIVYSDFNDYKDQLKKRIRATIAGAILEDTD